MKYFLLLTIIFICGCTTELTKNPEWYHGGGDVWCEDRYTILETTKYKKCYNQYGNET